MNPCVTVGVPVYRGQDTLPMLLECLRTQSYKDIDVLISVDGGDQASAEAAKPFLQQDPRLRMQVHPSRLGWAGNTDWTMRQRRGDFYIYQQHDDLVSPTYIAELVDAARRWPNAVLCFAKLRFTGQRDEEISSPSVLGGPKERALSYLRTLDWVPFRGLIRGPALAKTSGLLLSDFDPFDSLGTEHRFMAELALLGEFRFVEGPTYFKSWHGGNLSIKRDSWSREHWLTALAYYAAWMIEVIAPAGASARARRRLFKITLERFAGSQDPLKWIRNKSKALLPHRIWDHLKRSEKLTALQTPIGPWLGGILAEERAALLRQVFEGLKSGGRFDPLECLNTTWEELEWRHCGTTERRLAPQRSSTFRALS
jgi:glycosyltransferase involved in cell wall biosynthesis